MTTTVKYSLDEFVHDMSSLVDEQPDQERLFDLGSSYLERLINNPDAVPDEYRIPAIRNGRAGPTTAPTFFTTETTACS